jgi:uncharacterized protein (TIGR02453 family)
MFTKATFLFLDELAANNNREWFEQNKARYEMLVRTPALEYIEQMGPALEKIAPHFRADPRKIGGSLMRVHRDTRFSNDKTPYKTNIGIQFRHSLCKDVHAPGFYVHIATDECFLAVGCWHPEPDSRGKIRDLIVDDTEQWIAARDQKRFTRRWALSGDSLNRPPRGYDSAHLALDDLKRKDFIGVSPLSPDDVMSENLVKLTSTRFAAAVPFMSFLCAALEIPY